MMKGVNWGTCMLETQPIKEEEERYRWAPNEGRQQKTPPLLSLGEILNSHQRMVKRRPISDPKARHRHRDFPTRSQTIWTKNRSVV